jgi:hypothetical protein
LQRKKKPAEAGSKSWFPESGHADLRRIHPSKPSAEPNNQAVAGIGTIDEVVIQQLVHFLEHGRFNRNGDG